MLYTLEETLDAPLSTIKRFKWLEAGSKDACCPVDEKAGGLRHSPRPVSAAVDHGEHRAHIMLQVSRPTTCARRQGVPLASMIKTRDVRYQRSHALWNECLPDLDRQLLAKETAIAQRAA